MNKSLTWKGISLVIDSNITNKNELIHALENEGIELRNDTLENQSNYFIFENEFINQSTSLLMMFPKFINKNYKEETKVYVAKSNKFKIIKAKPDDLTKYKKILSQNILDGSIRKIDLSINVLNESLNDSIRSKLFLDILILLALANKSSYNSEHLEAEFKTEDKFYKIKVNAIHGSFIDLYPIYDWIMNEDEYEYSYSVKLDVVRKVITDKQDIRDVEGVLKDSKLAYKRIVSQKTDDYFEQLNRLKDDFLILSQNENTALRTLHITFFAWIGYLGIELFNIIARYESSNILFYLLCSKGTKKAIIIFMFIVALATIFIGYQLEIKSLKKTYNVIKEIYQDKILFETASKDKSKFEDIIKEPKVETLQKVIFTILIVSLFIRLMVAII